jgi:hypothetical protein
MRVSSSTERRIRSNILFVIGIIWISYFAFYKPEAMNPYFMTLGAAALFGPVVLASWQKAEALSQKEEEDKDAEQD